MPSNDAEYAGKCMRFSKYMTSGVLQNDVVRMATLSGLETLTISRVVLSSARV